MHSVGSSMIRCGKSSAAEEDAGEYCCCEDEAAPRLAQPWLSLGRRGWSGCGGVRRGCSADNPCEDDRWRLHDAVSAVGSAP